MDLLAQAERTVEEIARETATPVASVSQHLQVLKAARMVAACREGLYVHYRLADEGVFRAWQVVREPGAPRLAEVGLGMETYLKDRGAMEAVDYYSHSTIGEDDKIYIERYRLTAISAPSNHERIVGFDRSGGMQPGDPAELGARANRCAAG